LHQGLEPRARVDKFSGLSGSITPNGLAPPSSSAVCARLPTSTTNFADGADEQADDQHDRAVFLFANPKLFFTASRLIKEVAGYG